MELLRIGEFGYLTFIGVEVFYISREVKKGGRVGGRGRRGKREMRGGGRGVGRRVGGRKDCIGEGGECREIGRLRTHCDLYVLTVISMYLP